MSQDGKQLSLIDDTISTEGDMLGSSVSITLGENSIRLKDKPKPNPVKEPDPAPDVQEKEKWWVKEKTKPVKKIDSPVLSPDISSSMKDFLNKEKMCNKEEGQKKDKDDEDTLAGLEKYQSDLDNATDEDIGSMLEEMSKIAGTLSPVEEQSVKEILQAAEKLVQESSDNIMKDLLKESASIENNNTSEGLTRVRQLEIDIFKMIEDQVNDNNINSNSSNGKRRSASPSVEILFENLSKKSGENQLNPFDDQKAEVSSNSDLDDPISRHSITDDVNEEKKANEKSIKKEITDVEGDFFAFIKKSKESIDQLSSRSSSFEQEDIEQFLKLLQEKSNKEIESISKASSMNFIDQFDPLNDLPANDEPKEFKEKELVSVESKKIVYELESPVCQPNSAGAFRMERLLEESIQKESSRQSSRCSSKRSSAKNSVADAKKVINDKNELYNVGLTPRLELFADAIPKLKAEKTNEANSRREEEQRKEEEKDNQTTPKSDDNEDFSFKNFRALDVIKCTEVLKDHRNVTDVKDFNDLIDLEGDENQDYPDHFRRKSSDHPKTERVISAPEKANPKGESYIGKSRSYDQLPKQTSRLGSSFENVRHAKSIESRKPVLPTTQRKILPPKPKIQPRTVTKVSAKSKIPPKTRREPMRPYQSDYSLDVRGNQIRYEDASNLSYGGGDWKGAGEETLEMLYQDERQRFMHLKTELEAEIETYKSKLKDIQLLHEQEMFSLKKQNILLRAKVDELAQINKKTADARSKFDPKIMAMQKELQKQENLILAYETENKKLVQETKRLQNELKSASSQQKTKITVGDSANINNQELFEKLKDLQEENVKLNFEVSDLRQKNADISLKNEDVIHQNSLLQEELEMIRDQLRAKNDFINDRLQAMTTNELELRKQAEDLKVELHSKTEQLKCIKQDYERFQQSAEPLEKEIIDLRTKCTYFQEKLQTAKNNCEREKQLTQKLKDQVIIDSKNIMDLNRQVREMERILKRKNPDSVSALILTANSEHEKLNAEKVKLLEERITYLESEIKAKEDMAQLKLSEIQKRFTDMKDKYSMQVSELEHKLKTSPREMNKNLVVSYNEVGTQTIPRALESRGSEPNLADKSNRVGPKSQNLKEDTHLIATIRGLKLELTNKDKTITKVTKEFQELQKTNRKLQKEREKLLNERRNLDKLNNRVMTSSDSKLSSLKMMEANDANSNFYQNGLSNDKKLSSSTQKLYDPMLNENTEVHNRLKKLANENEVLKEELSRINKDFTILKNKRLQDLNLLQEEHEKEIALIVKEYSTQADDTKALKLQGQVNSQMAMISHLKQQIDKLQDYKDQVIILKAERDHLEGKNRMLNDKVKYLSTPSSQQLQLLQDKITILQQRHETRELSLQKLVRDLLRSRNQSCKDCKGSSMDKGKQQLCYYRQELDSILGTLQDLTNP